MIIYGTKTFDLKTATFPFACSSCGHERQQIYVHRTFFSLYYIPLIPFKKIGLIKCPMCYREVKKGKFFKELASKVNPAEAKFQFKSILKSARTPFHAVASAYLIATLFAGVMTYWYYEEQKKSDQANFYRQKPSDNVIAIIKIQDDPYPYQIMYIPEIQEGEALIFDWKYGYKTLSDARGGLESAIDSTRNKSIKNHFFEPTIMSTEYFPFVEFADIHPLETKVDWRQFFADQQ